MEIINTPLTLLIHGFQGTAINKDYTGTAFSLSGRMWQAVKTNGLKNKGLNIWVYGQNEQVFTGVELIDAPGSSGLEEKSITLAKYAYYKHIGPYQLIKQAGQNMIAELKAKGLETTLPYIEIYGHWNADDTKVETELFMSLK